MRIAFVDLIFTWPPLGGAPLDVYYTMEAIQALGHEVHLFYGSEPENWRLDPVREDKLPFPATCLPFRRAEAKPEIFAKRFREAVDGWKPDVVFMCFGFFMKPAVSLALSHYPQVARFYAYEMFCPRDYRMFWKTHVCPYNYLKTPNVCRRCTINGFFKPMVQGNVEGYAREYEQSQAWTHQYYEDTITALKGYKAVIVYNHFTKGLLADFTDKVHVIGGGVHLQDFAYLPLKPKGKDERKIIFISGRLADYTKGIKTLWDAGEILWKDRQDFEIWATFQDGLVNYPFFKGLGWKDIDQMMECYQQSDICVVPSIWAEPFGLVAVEGMATGRPCVVSDVGGLQEIVVHGETGFIFKNSDPHSLAHYLRLLLDDPEMRVRMGDAGRKRVEEVYDWKKVVANNYPRLLEEVMK